ncbi:MAG: MFS transporter [Opitutaceae bacterium]
MHAPIPPTGKKPEIAPKIWTAGTLTYTGAALVPLFFWLLFGDFAWSMRDRSIGQMSAWYLNHLKVSNLAFGLLMSSLPVLIGLILGPIISVKSDHHRGKWGRRIPFLLVTTPLATFGMLGLASTPFIARWVHGFFPEQSAMLVALICFGVFWTSFEVATIAANAVFGGLINDVVPRPLLGRFYGMFRAVSLIDGMIFNYWLMGKVPDHFSIIMTGIGLFYGAAFMWVCFKVKEGDYPPPPPEDNCGPMTGLVAGTKTYVRECFASSYYRWVFVMLMAAALAFAPINTFALPYALHLGLKEDTYGKFLALTYVISLCLAYPLGWLADKFHPLRMAIVTLLGYLAVTVWGGLYATTPGTFLFCWVLHGVFSGCYFTGAASLAMRLFPQNKFAQFQSAAGIVASPAQMTLAPLLGMIIDRSGNTYSYTFVGAVILAVIAIAAAIQVYRKFIRLGGPDNYVAPV